MELNPQPKRNPISSIDRISDMPDNVIDSILVRLPIREALRTGILSTKWRYKCLTLSQLVFNDEDLTDLLVNLHKFSNMVNDVLLLHEGQIQKFSLNVSFIPTSVNQWLHYSSKNGVKEIELQFWCEERYKVPYYIFYCHQLTRLYLFKCTLPTLPTHKFTVFYSLTSLTLHQVPISNEAFETLILSCPHLERFDFSSVGDAYFPLLSIPAPKLKNLRLESEFGELCLGNNPLLDDVFILLRYSNYIDLEHKTCTSIIDRVLGCTPGIRRLQLNELFVMFLATGKVPDRLLIPYNRLETLQLYGIKFDDLDMVSVVLCLIRSSPNLQRLEISAWIDPYEVLEPGLDLFKDQYHSDFSFNQLRIMKMTDIQGVIFELQFLKFVLARSPVLEMMTLKPDEYSNIKVPIFEELLQLQRASAQARIIYLDPDQD